MNPRFYCEQCGFEVFPGSSECDRCGAKLARTVWDKPVVGPTMDERKVQASPIQSPEDMLIPPVGKPPPFAKYPRSGDERCPKCGREQSSGWKICNSCGYQTYTKMQRAAAFALMLMSTSCVCCGPCMIGSGDSSGASIILLSIVFLALYIWGWVEFTRRFR